MPIFWQTLIFKVSDLLLLRGLLKLKIVIDLGKKARIAVKKQKKRVSFERESAQIGRLFFTIQSSKVELI